MGLMRRISATITSSVDRAVSKVENHDAIINAALRDTQQAAARSRVRLERLKKDGASLKARRDELETAIGRWTERARRLASEDEAKALTCLKRKRECETQLKGLVGAIAKHDELELRIAEQVNKIEARVSEVTQQRNMLRSRQSVADAMQAIQRIECGTGTDIEDAIERWEINLGESEFLYGTSTATDPLESELLAEEETADLRAELDDLLASDREES